MNKLKCFSPLAVKLCIREIDGCPGHNANASDKFVPEDMTLQAQETPVRAYRKKILPEWKRKIYSRSPELTTYVRALQTKISFYCARSSVATGYLIDVHCSVVSQ